MKRQILLLLTLILFAGYSVQAKEPQQRTATPREGQRQSPWVMNLKIYQEQLQQDAPDLKKLSIALANLAVIAVEKRSPLEAIKIFEEVSQKGIMPPQVKPYFGSLLFHKYLQEGNVSKTRGSPVASSEPSSHQAYQLFSESYDDELGQDVPDENRLLDIGMYILMVCKSEE
jgi:hypothetical protein